MGSILESSAVSRIQRRRHELVLDLALQRGASWAMVAAIRQRWGITASPQLPPALPPEVILKPWEGTYYFPPEWPQRLPTSPLAGRCPEADELTDDPPPDMALSTEYSSLELAVANWLGFTIPDGGRMEPDELLWRVWWFKDLWRLHDELIPESCRHHGPCPAVAWATFFSGCLVYDPPRSQLLAFADGFPVIADYPEALLDPGLDDPTEDEAAVLMAHAPLVRLRDERALQNAMTAYNEAVFSLLCAAVAPSGIDLRRLRERVVADHPKLTERFREQLRAAPRRRYIDADRDGVTEEDVRAAAKLLWAGRKSHPAGRLPRDLLVCVQCAIWRDEDNWSLAQMADRFGWKTQEPNYADRGEVRCETARQHIREGRDILKKQSNPST